MSKDGARGETRTLDPRFTKEGRGEVERVHDAHPTQEAGGAVKSGRPLRRPAKTYLVVAIGLPFFKVGRSWRPDGRVRGIQTGCPVPCEIVHVEDGDREAELHRLLTRHRAEGEWFRATRDSLDALRSAGMADAAAEIELAINSRRVTPRDICARCKEDVSAATPIDAALNRETSRAPLVTRRRKRASAHDGARSPTPEAPDAR